jgi:hypothetical protein
MCFRVYVGHLQVIIAIFYMWHFPVIISDFLCMFFLSGVEYFAHFLYVFKQAM